MAFASSLKQESSERYCMLSDASRWQVGHCRQSEAETERYCMLFDASRWQDGHCGQSKAMHIPMQAGGEPLRAVYTHMYFSDSLIHVSVTIMPFGLLAIAFMSSSFYPHSSCPLAYSHCVYSPCVQQFSVFVHSHSWVSEQHGSNDISIYSLIGYEWQCPYADILFQRCLVL